jgi:hypothetical protein
MIVSAVFVLLSQFALSFTFNILRFIPPITPFFSFPVLCFILLTHHSPRPPFVNNAAKRQGRRTGGKG